MSCWIKVVTRRAFYFLAETSFQKTNRWNKTCWKMFSWCLICWMNLFPVRSSGAAAQRTCQREVIEGHAVLHLVPLQLLLVQRRQRSRQIFHRGRRRVWRYEQTQVQMFVQVLNVIIWHYEWDKTSFCQQPMRCCSRSSATLCPPTATTSTTRPSERIRPPTSPAAVHRTPTPSPDRWQQRLYKESSTKTTFSNVCPSQ